MARLHVCREWIDGFADRPELPPLVRVRLARLSERYAPETLSAAQRDLLAYQLDCARRSVVFYDVKDEHARWFASLVENVEALIKMSEA